MLGFLPRGTAYIAVFIVLVLLTLTYAPIYFSAIQFHDEARQIVRFAASSRQSVEDVREEIQLAAQEFIGMPLEDDELRFREDGAFFQVEIQYSVPVNMRIYQHEITFGPWELSGESFIE